MDLNKIKEKLIGTVREDMWSALITINTINGKVIEEGYSFNKEQRIPQVGEEFVLDGLGLKVTRIEYIPIIRVVELYCDELRVTKVGNDYYIK